MINKNISYVRKIAVLVLNRFLQSHGGNVTPMFAFMFVALTAAIGGAYDFSRAFEARTALQAAVDGAALAAGADETDDKNRMHGLAAKYLQGNAPQSSVVSVGVLTTDFDPATKTVSASLTGEVPTAFMSMLGVSSVTITAVSQAKRSEPGPLEVVLALDTTASMNDLVDGVKKITTLKTAAVNLVNTVMASPYAKVGIVPFGGAMNLGTVYKDKNWVLPRPNYVSSSCTSTLVKAGSGYSCKSTSYSCVSDGVPKTCTSSTCTWEVAPVYTSVCSDVTYSWNGCVGSRKNSESVISSSSNPKYAWTYNSCGPIILDLSATKTTVVNKINSLSGALDTYIPIGLVWAWNMLTPEEPLTSARTKDDMAEVGGKKVIVLMTDGMNSLRPSYYTNGSANFDSISTASNPAASQAEVDNTLKQLCTNVKKDGIILYTIAFSVTDSNIKSILKNCASDNAKYFDASDSSGLTDAFSKIGESLQRLRITK